MRTWWAVAAMCVLAAPGAARADVPATGFKFRDLRVVIDNLDDYPDHVFYLAAAGWLGPAGPRFGLSGSEEPRQLVPGQPFRPGHAARWQYEWVLVSLPRRWAERGEVTWAALAPDAPGARHSNRVHLAQPGSVPILNPVDYEVRHFRISFDGDRPTLAPGAVELHADGFGSWVPAVLLTAAVVVAGLWVARRLTRSARTRPGAPTPAPDAPA